MRWSGITDIIECAQSQSRDITKFCHCDCTGVHLIIFALVLQTMLTDLMEWQYQRKCVSMSDGMRAHSRAVDNNRYRNEYRCTYAAKVKHYIFIRQPHSADVWSCDDVNADAICHRSAHRQRLRLRTAVHIMHALSSFWDRIVCEQQTQQQHRSSAT